MRNKIITILILAATFTITSCSGGGGGDTPLSSAKAITSFSFLNPTSTGLIDENAKTILLLVPTGTNVTALVATYITTGTKVQVGSTMQISGTTPNDFTHPVIYTVTAADGSTTSYTVTVTSHAPTSAVVKLYTQGTLASGSKLGGVDIKIDLPSGVTVNSTTNAPQTDSGVVVPSGQAASNSTSMGSYTPASGSTPGVLRFLLANPNGFGIGEFATVTCDIASGSTPTQADFSLPTVVITDLNGVTLSGITVGFTAEFN